MQQPTLPSRREGTRARRPRPPTTSIACVPLRTRGAQSVAWCSAVNRPEFEPARPDFWPRARSSLFVSSFSCRVRFIYELQVSDALLKAGQARTVLLVGAEVHSGFMPRNAWDVLFGRGGEPPTEEEKAVVTRFRDRAVLFGDAAGAVVLRAGEGERGILGFQLHSDGSNFKDLYVPGVGFAHRPFVDEEQVREWRHVPEMNGRAVFKLAVSRMPQAVRELCAKQHLAVGDIDLLIAHQANLRISEAVQRALGLPDERVYNNIQKYGNTTAATIPIALDECRKSGRIRPGQLVCFVGLGSGFHWGAALMRA